MIGKRGGAMIHAEDLKGVCAMMPAFTTSDGGSVNATATVDIAITHCNVSPWVRLYMAQCVIAYLSCPKITYLNCPKLVSGRD